MRTSPVKHLLWFNGLLLAACLAAAAAILFGVKIPSFVTPPEETAAKARQRIGEISDPEHLRKIALLLVSQREGQDRILQSLASSANEGLLALVMFLGTVAFVNCVYLLQGKRRADAVAGIPNEPVEGDAEE
jgi:hypothetical protein